ncbi:MAG: HAD family hydrolase [Chloroflexi bacterium]|nr:HAD family hydrolase [Chloroflexota bacterium]
MQVKAVVFDMFNTLARNETALWVGLFGDLCRIQGLDVSPQVLWERWKTIEMGFRRARVNLEAPEQAAPFVSYRTAWTDCFRRTFDELGLAGDAAAAAQMSIESLGCRDLYPETKDVLARLDGRWRLCVLSNADKDFLYPLLRRHDLRFDVTITSEEARAYKPHPAPFRSVLERLGVAPGEAVQVGDTLHEDVLGAKLVGMKAVWANRRGLATDPGLPQPDAEVQDLRGLLGLLGLD